MNVLGGLLRRRNPQWRDTFQPINNGLQPLRDTIRILVEQKSRTKISNLLEILTVPLDII
jgi:hypothetical protein